MNGLPYFPLYVQDFLMGTMGMSDAEVAAYIRLLCLQWDKGEIQEDDIKKAVSMSQGRSKTATIMSVLNNKFDIINGAWVNKRLAEERDRLTNLHAKKRAAGKKGGESKRDRSLAQLEQCSSTAKAELKHSSSIQNQNQNQNQSITTNSTSKKTQPVDHQRVVENSTLPRKRPIEFDDWWTALKAIPKRDKVKAKKKFNAFSDERLEALIQATANYERYLQMPDAPYAMNAYRFIGGAFEDFGDTEVNDLIKQLETRNTPYQAGDHLIKPMEEKLARKEAEAEADIVEGRIVKNETALIGEQSADGKINAQDVAEYERLQNSEIYQFLSNHKTNP